MRHLILLALSFCYSIAAAQNRPNIIYIMADDLGSLDLGCYGNPYNETPHLDSLARGGIRCTQAYSASPVCTPSRAAIMTGKYPARLKVTNFMGGERTEADSPVLPAKWVRSLPESEVTLAERLGALGYQTGMVGKWHLGSEPWKQGFGYARVIGKNGLDYYNYDIVGESGKRVFTDNGTNYLTDKLTDYALEFIEKRSANQPFFLYLTYSAPHVLLVPRGDKLSKYFFKYERFKGEYNPNYAAMIESMDDGVGRIVEVLKKQGLLENTLLVFTSDNGAVGLAELGPRPAPSDPLRRWKGHVYEGGIRIPAIFYWKGVLQPRVCDQYFSNVDYTPTFLQALEQPHEVVPDGKSIWPVLQSDKATLERGALYWHYPHFSNQQGRPAGAMRLGDWKLVRSYERSNYELYNLRTDPSEQHNLAKKQKTVLRDLTRQFEQWLVETGAEMPIPKKE